MPSSSASGSAIWESRARRFPASACAAAAALADLRLSRLLVSEAELFAEGEERGTAPQSWGVTKLALPRLSGLSQAQRSPNGQIGRTSPALFVRECPNSFAPSVEEVRTCGSRYPTSL